MTVRSIEDYLPEHPFFAGSPAEVIELLAGCAHNVHFRAQEVIFQEGQSADHFYLIRHGRVAVQVHRTAGGPSILSTVDAGDVLGWSWLVPPYRWLFDARATVEASAVCFDAACVRAKCDEDPAIGYPLMSRVAQVMHQRLEAARVQLLDLYGRSTP